MNKAILTSVTIRIPGGVKYGWVISWARRDCARVSASKEPMISSPAGETSVEERANAATLDNVSNIPAADKNKPQFQPILGKA